LPGVAVRVAMTVGGKSGGTLLGFESA
jgi:RNA polymerase sigma-70 factor (ECF subfamily)